MHVSPGVSTGRASLVFSTGAPTPSTTGTLTVSLAQDVFLWPANTGSVPVGSDMTATVTLTSTGGSLTSLERCSGTWNESANTCSGSVSTLVTTSTSGRTVALDPAAGSALRLRLRTNASADKHATLGVALRL